MNEPYQNIIAFLAAHAAKFGDELCVELFSRRAKPQTRTFGEVYAAAGRAAVTLHARGLRRGDVLVMVGTHHIDFYAVWLGCVWLGAIPTVLAEPSVRIDREIYWSRLGELLGRIRAWGLALGPRLDIEPGRFAGQTLLWYDEISQGTGQPPPHVNPNSDDILLLQHSSGTTGLHKGVMLSHGAIWRHFLAYRESLELSRQDCVVTWLPLYHDMGFIACFIMPLIAGVPVVWLSPFEWVANPGLLLTAITERRPTLAWLPNFAFEFLTRRVKVETGKYELSSLRALINCSEPVTAEAMDHFATRFVDSGFAPAALHTCYAMAENVFAVSATTKEHPPKRRRVSRRAWHDEHVAELASSDDKDPITHVSNGPCLRECAVRIVDGEGQPLPPYAAGQVLINSPFLFTGYFRRDDVNQDLFDSQGFYNTGDLGYVDEAGHVYITGRQKDLVIVGGKNIYPQDIEASAAEVAGVYPGRVVCFGVYLAQLGTEGVVVLLESEEADTIWPDIARKVRGVVATRLDLDVFDCRVVQRGQLRKSTSGKLARDGNRQWYLDGRFGAIAPDLRSGETQ
jgi:fatty-acyl-CoA synthase